MRRTASWQSRLLSRMVALSIRRQSWGADARAVARRARRKFGAPGVWGSLRALGLSVQAAADGPVPMERVARRATDDADGVLLYLHGGGFLSCSPRTHRPITAALARATGLAVYAPAYRLAPEHPFPAALDDATRAYDWLRARGISADRIVVAGDSPGGNLVLGLLGRIEAQSLGRPAAAVLFSPWADLTASGESIHRNDGRDVFFRPQNMREFREAYLNGADAADPEASPLLGALAGLPPLLVQVSSGELLLDDARRVVHAAHAPGVDAVLEEYPDAMHCWQMLDGLVPEASEAIASAAAFIRSQMAR